MVSSISEHLIWRAVVLPICSVRLQLRAPVALHFNHCFMHRKRLPLITLLVVLIMAAGAIGWWLASHHSRPSLPKEPAHSSSIPVSGQRSLLPVQPASLEHLLDVLLQTPPDSLAWKDNISQLNTTLTASKLDELLRQLDHSDQPQLATIVTSLTDPGLLKHVSSLLKSDHRSPKQSRTVASMIQMLAVNSSDNEALETLLKRMDSFDDFDDLGFVTSNLMKSHFSSGDTIIQRFISSTNNAMARYAAISVLKRYPSESTIQYLTQLATNKAQGDPLVSEGASVVLRDIRESPPKR